MIAEEVHEYCKAVASSGYRGLLVLLGEPRRVYGLLSILQAQKPLLVFWPGKSVDIARSILENWDFAFCRTPSRKTWRGTRHSCNRCL